MCKIQINNKEAAAKRIIVPILVLLLSSFTLADDVGYEALSENLIKNPSLETDSEGWEYLNEHCTRYKKYSIDGKYTIMGDGRGISEKTRIGAKCSIHLEGGCVYRLSAWFQSDNECYIVIRLEQEGKIISDIGVCEGTPNYWIQRHYVFHADKTGEYKIFFEMPTTSRKSNGRVWLDKVSLVKIGTTKSLMDIGSGLYDDYPCAAGDGQGNIWMACLAFDDKTKTEKIIFRRYDGVKWTEPKEVAAARQMFAPALAVNRKAQWAVWSQRDDDNWDIYARQIGPDMGTVIKVTSSPAVDRHAMATITSSGDVWVAWQTDRHHNQDIYAATVNNPNIDPIQISKYKGSDYNPSIVAVDKKVYIAWDSFRNGNYDVFMKTVDRGLAGVLYRISDSADTDRYPQLSSDESKRVWIVYNHSTINGNLFGRRYNKTFDIRCFSNKKLYEPVIQKTRVWDIEEQGEEFPTLDVSEQFGTRLFCAETKKNLLCWMLAGRTLSDMKWTQPKLMSGTAFTTCRRPCMVRQPDGTAWLIWVSTDRFRNFKRSNNELCNSTISALKLDKLPKKQRCSPPLNEVPLKKALIADTAEEDRQQIMHQGRKFHIYYGDLHAHSTLSTCANHLDSPPDDQYSYSRDNANNDFCAVTDHGMHLDNYDFHRLKKLANANNQPGHFVAFMAQEYSSCRYYHEGYGHKNIIYLEDNPQFYFNPLKSSILPQPYACPSPAEMWAALRGKKAITIPHQLADAGVGAYTDWSYMNKELQPVAEILQGRGNYEYLGCPREARLFKKGHSLQDAWNMGHVIGVIASPDHGGSWGRAAVIAEDLTRESIFNALKKRRCYGTTMAHIYLDFRINDHMMGEEITIDSATSPRQIKVVSDFEALQTLVLFKNNKEILRKPITGGRIELEYTDSEPLSTEKASWYYVRVEAKENKYGHGPELAWSSPIWVSVKK